MSYYRTILNRSRNNTLLSSSSSLRRREPFSSVSSSCSVYTDVLIVGGGVVGCSLARLLNERLPTLSVSLIEARGGPPPPSKEEQAPRPQLPHPRSYALSPRSLDILGKQTTSNIPLGYYYSMQVWESLNPATLIFTNKDVCTSADEYANLDKYYLGAVAEDMSIVQSLWEQILQKDDDDNENNTKTKCYTNTTVEDLIVPSGGDEGSSSLVSVTTNHGQVITTKLLVGADGANSQIRNKLGISRVGYDYGKQALTFTVQLQGSHGKRAFQRFLPEGPIALLPTYSDNHSIVVWSTTPEIVQQWKSITTETEEIEFARYLTGLFQEGPQRLEPLFEQQQQQQQSATTVTNNVVNNFLSGCERIIDTVHYGASMLAAQSYEFVTPPTIMKVTSPKFSFDLSCRHVETYVKPRIALIGDAAHNVHPMAGQGLNLGLADVETLVNCMESQVKVGMDFSDSATLQEYENDRKKQVTASLAGIHALHEIYGIQQPVIAKHVKSLGMNMIQNFSPLRRKIVQAATYGVVF